MVLAYVDDVLLREVARRFGELANCIQNYMMQSSTASSSNSSCSCIGGPCPRLMLLERILLLHWRSQDVLVDFSGYYCLSLLLDQRSPLATYFIDLFHQLQWLLEALMLPAQYRTVGDSEEKESISLSEDLYHKGNDLLHYIRRPVKICRYLFVASLIGKRIDGWKSEKSLSKILKRLEKTGRERKDQIRYIERQAHAHRELPMDRFHAGLKRLPFVNLDRCSRDNRVELGKKLGEGSSSVVYQGSFVNSNPSNRSTDQQIVGQPVAVKVFRSGDIMSCSGACESEVGSKFFNQMEAMLQHKESALSGRQTESIATDEAFSEELWKLVTAKHPNVISARGYIGKRPEGESGLVMELMSTSLQEFLEKVAEPLQEIEMLDLMLEIAKGMRFLHECNLVHRDLKPQNVLLRFSEQLMINGGSRRKHTAYPSPVHEVKLADFGLAQRIVTKGDSVQVSRIETCEPVGTHCYMAPELLRRATFWTSDKVDVFSYGTTCFNILTCKDDGALGFTYARSNLDATEFYKAVRSNKWRDRWGKGKPEYLVDLISRCWAFDACQRPTFAAICCLLQSAMLCILAPPLISEQALSRALTVHSFLAPFQSGEVECEVVGIPMMMLCLSRIQSFFGKLETGRIAVPRNLDFLDDLKDRASTLMVRSAAENKSACNKLKANIADQSYASSNTYTGKAVIRLVRKGQPQ